MNLFGSISGEYKLCCFSEYAPNSVTLGTYDQEIDAVWNGEAMKKIRKDLLEGNPVPDCEWACYNKEQLGSESARQIVNHRYQDLWKLQASTLDDGFIKTYPTYLDVRFGNLCNFTCRMCGPHSSTSWYKEEPIHTNKAIDHYTDNETFWKNIDKIAPWIQEVYFAGGEPFVQEGHYKLLTYLINNNYSNNIEVSYNTNLSYRKFKKYDLVELWNNFKNVKVWPSVDGFGKQNEYSRKGFNWEQFKENVDYYSKHIESFSSVIHMYSIWSMPEFILWAKKKKFKVHGTTLIAPAHQSITCFPKDVKKRINNKYKDFFIRYLSILDNDEVNMIKSWLTYMNSVDNSHILHEFKKANDKLDASRDEAFLDFYPEHESWYKNI